jgi:hypothetical protein
METRTNLFVIFTVAAIFFMATESFAESITVTLGLHSHSGQTNIYRAEISNCGLSSIYRVIVLDSAKGGGSDGIYTGSDIDFVLFDRDGVLSTFNDQIALLETENTVVRAGTVRDKEDSMFQPSVTHPGVLFGLKRDGSLDFATATLRVHDASYTDLQRNRATGWVSIGDEGLLEAEFEPFSLDEFTTLYLLIGEVGIGSGEELLAILSGDS